MLTINKHSQFIIIVFIITILNNFIQKIIFYIFIINIITIYILVIFIFTQFIINSLLWLLCISQTFIKIWIVMNKFSFLTFFCNIFFIISKLIISIVVFYPFFILLDYFHIIILFNFIIKYFSTPKFNILNTKSKLTWGKKIQS